jgi:hypothetical protein
MARTSVTMATVAMPTAAAAARNAACRPGAQ